jgi:hypothetical protein
MAITAAVSLVKERRSGRQAVTAERDAVPAGGIANPHPGGLGIKISQHSLAFLIVDFDAYSSRKRWIVVAQLFRRFLFGVTYVAVR